MTQQTAGLDLGASSMLRRPPPLRFSTDGLAPKDRFPAFVEANVGAGFTFSTPSPLAFEVEIELQALRQLDLFVCRRLATELTGHVTAATAGRPRRICILLCHQGGLHGSQCDVESSAGPGDALILRTHLPGTVTNAAGAQLHSIIVDEDALAPMLRSELPRAVGQIPWSNPSLKLLSCWLRALSDAEVALDDQLKVLVERYVFDLLILALDARDDAREEAEARTGRSARLQAILSQIAKRSSEPVTAELVGATLGISDRYVRQLLEESGKTFTEHLMEQRLTHAFRLLNDSRLADLKISEIALRAGFNDISHFNRSFRRRFGDTPMGARGGGTK